MFVLTVSTLLLLQSPPSTKAQAQPATSAQTAATGATVARDTAGSLNPVEALLSAINAADTTALHALLSGPMKEALSADKAAPWMQGVVRAKGKLLNLHKQSGGERTTVYRVDAERGSWELHLTLDPATHLILGMKLLEPTAQIPVESSTMPLRLPMRGEWLVVWGGDTLERNQHVTHQSQRRAADLIQVGADGKSFHGPADSNTSYDAYGEPIIAVADGTVVTVVDGVPDNTPGFMNPYQTPGNMVIIKHSDRLYSVYAHLQPGSAKAKVGSKVKAGQAIGLCGNSGNSSEAHLHFQLQDGPLFERSNGIDAVFKDVHVKRNGKSVTDASYHFSKDDVIKSSQ